MTDFIQRNCPSCTKANAHPAMVSQPPAESLTYEELTSYWSGFFKQKVFFSYYRCLCGLLYCPAFFSEEQLQNLYKNMSDNTAGVSIAALNKTQHNYFKTLKQYSNLSGHYLEFGPDIGLFTQYCVKEGRFDSFWLCEPNQDVWPTLKQNVLQKPHHIFSDIQTSTDNIPDSSISTVAMIHVLDHLIDPMQMLETLKPKLAPGALLLIVTHDEQSRLAKIIKAKWPPYCLQHPQLLNRQSISTLLKNAGFSVLTCEKTYNYFPITYLMKHALYVLGIKNVRLPQLNKLQLGLKLGNIITIAKLD